MLQVQDLSKMREDKKMLMKCRLLGIFTIGVLIDSLDRKIVLRHHVSIVSGNTPGKLLNTEMRVTE